MMNLSHVWAVSVYISDTLLPFICAAVETVKSHPVLATDNTTFHQYFNGPEQSPLQHAVWFETVGLGGNELPVGTNTDVFTSPFTCPPLSSTTLLDLRVQQETVTHEMVAPKNRKNNNVAKEGLRKEGGHQDATPRFPCHVCGRCRFLPPVLGFPD